MTVIGNADGPTTIFLASKMGGSWINIFGIIIMILMLIPNIVYAIKSKQKENYCKNKLLNVIEQIGRYGSMFLMCFHVGIADFGYASVEAFLGYIIGNALLMILYWIGWGLYFKKYTLWKSMVLAIIPFMIFLISGITLRYYLLVGSAIIFGVGHIYVTYQNAKVEK